MSNTELAEYKSKIDTDIAEHSQLLLERWQRDYGVGTAQVFDAYLSVLSRGGKRLRGSLAMWAYARVGGDDEELALRAARVLEMSHAYLLVIDDIADEADTRRGDASAHKLLEKYHQDQNWAGSGRHFGRSQAMNAALAGQHLVMQEITELPASDSVKLEALRELSAVLAQTVAGQMTDMNHQAIQEVNEHEVISMMQRKTASYSFVSPLQFGVTLAGGDWSQYEWLEEWALNIGLSFQLRDDILGVFGNQKITGKSNLDDLREGKITLLIVRALSSGSAEHKNQLLSILGQPDIGESELNTAQEIITDTGALAYVEGLSKNYEAKAIEALDTQNNTEFLETLSRMITRRQS